MPARAIGTATVSFGLVSIPVKLYPTAEAGRQLSFNLLHKECGSRLKQQYVCPKDGATVAREDMVKGYEFSKDRYVTFTPEELKALEEQATQAVEITEFLPGSKVDPIYFDRSYYLGPDKGSDKAYGLLVRAMSDSGRVAVAKYAARGKQYLVLLRPAGDALVMQQLHYADEVRSVADVPLAKLEVKDAELRLAMQLIDQISAEEFHPEAYEDEVRKRTEAQIQRKVEGEEISAAPQETGKGQIIDLMEALKASLAETTPKTKSRPTSVPAPKVEPAEPAPAPADERRRARVAVRNFSSRRPARQKAAKE